MSVFWNGLGLVVNVVLFGGLILGLVDMLVRIHRLPVRKGEDRVWVLSTYPFLRGLPAEEATPPAPPQKRELKPVSVHVHVDRQG